MSFETLSVFKPLVGIWEYCGGGATTDGGLSSFLITIEKQNSG